jgi:nitrate/nitrite transport system substrate-binding protein
LRKQTGVELKHDAQKSKKPRRRFIGQAAAALGASQLRSVAWAAGSDAPEKKEVKVGFIPLTDCSSVVMASVMEFDKKYGIKIVPSKEASWAAVRDKLVNGELDAAHVLWGLIYGVQMGLGGPKTDMAILMNLNHNGQAMTLSRKLYDKGVKDATSLAALIAKEKGEYTFAHTFPTGTHAMWLYYWLATYGVHPFNDVKTITVPPPQMVANMRVGNMDGYCVGEPWPYRAIVDKIGFTAETTQGIWKDHPEKALGCTAAFVQKNPNTARAMTAAIIDAGRWIDASLSNRQKTAEVVSDKSYVNTDKEVIVARMLGRYDNGIGKSWDDKDHMKFYNDGHTPFPYLSDGMWFLTQHRRWGLLKQDVDYVAIARQVNRLDIYKQAADAAKASMPKESMRTSKFIDGVVWDGKNPTQFASSFKIKAVA